jgi:hypothetical protein
MRRRLGWPLYCASRAPDLFFRTVRSAKPLLDSGRLVTGSYCLSLAFTVTRRPLSTGARPPGDSIQPEATRGNEKAEAFG